MRSAAISQKQHGRRLVMIHRSSTTVVVRCCSSYTARKVTSSSSVSGGPDASSTTLVSTNNSQQQQQQQQQQQRLFSSLPIAARSHHFHIFPRHDNIRLFSSTSDNDNKSSTANEEWIPPPPRVIVDKEEDVEITLEEASQQHLKDQQLHKQQFREDKLKEEEEALLQLTEEELKTLSDDEILRRVEKALELEEELEKRQFQEELEREELLKEKAAASSVSDNNNSTDWLQTRRAALGQKETDAVIEVIPHTLLTADEIETLLQKSGGTNLTTIMDDPDEPRMGGAHGMILCTAGGSDDHDVDDNDSFNAIAHSTNPFLINTLARILIDHLKERQLDEMGVLGAQMGTNHLVNRGNASYNTQTQNTWHVVDCGNYIVHIMDAHTRHSLKLEDLWSGKDPLWRLNFLDDDAVEEYCARHPVPASYNGGSHMAGDASPSNWDPSMIRRLERHQYATGGTLKHRPVIPNATKRKDRQAGRRRKREQRQAQRRQQQQSGGQY